MRLYTILRSYATLNWGDDFGRKFRAIKLMARSEARYSKNCLYPHYGKLTWPLLFNMSGFSDSVN